MSNKTFEEDLTFPLIIENGMDYLNLTTKIFNNGAKWQQERMYSEEDLKEAFKSCYTPFSFDRIGDLEQDFNNWFEQFKKGGNNEQ